MTGPLAGLARHSDDGKIVSPSHCSFGQGLDFPAPCLRDVVAKTVLRAVGPCDESGASRDTATLRFAEYRSDKYKGGERLIAGWQD
jgi:hypothetical protein